MTDRQPFLSRGVWLALAVALLASCGGGGLLLWKPIRAFAYGARHGNRVIGLVNVARTRPLTDAEFAQALAYLDAPHTATRLAALAALNVEAERDAARKPVVVERLTGLAADPDIGPAVTAVLGRLTGPPQ